MDMRDTRTVQHSDIGRWEQVRRSPAPALAGAVQALYGYEQVLDQPATHRTMPTPFLPLVITFGHKHRFPGASGERVVGSFVAGPHEHAGVLHADGFHGVQVNLTPPAALRLLGVPLREVAGAVVELDEVVGRQAGPLVDRLASAPTWAARLTLLEAFLMRRLEAGRAASPQVHEAWRCLLSTGGAARIRDVADHVGWSRRHLTERFSAELGLSPKRMARLLRFDRVNRALQQPRAPNLATLAVTAGYYDQAHMSNEVRQLCGLTPGQLLAGSHSSKTSSAATP